MRLGSVIRDALASRDNELFISTASIWEIAIKHAAGRLSFPVDQFDDLARRMALTVLPILPAHAIAAAALPRHHGDPFDRMLVAQAVVEGLDLVSSDRMIGQYDVRLFPGP